MKLSALDRRTQYLVFAILAAFVLRLGFAAWAPLSFDEAYYWLWSRNLDLSYFDHPPAIAYAIRAGTALFGDTSIGVRVVPVLLSIAASWAVWEAGAAVTGNAYGGAWAALVFNLTPMVGIETLAATPDALEIVAAAFMLWALVKVQQTGRGAWWLAVGAAAGFAMLSKYTAFFLGAGILVWLLAAQRQRHWLLTAWPYAGAALAFALFAPVIVWNVQHDWMSFAKQLGRVDAGGFTLRFLGEFLLTQLGLASPFVAVLGVAGFVRAARSPVAWNRSSGLLAALMVPSVIYFIVHSLHDRVQGNWPSFLYPSFAIAAAACATNGPVTRLSRLAAIPVAAAMMLVIYAQAVWGIVPLQRDPVARLMAFGIAPVTAAVEKAVADTKADAILTTDYAHNGWLSFYLHVPQPVVQINERYRYVAEQVPPPGIFETNVIYVTDTRRDMSAYLRGKFAQVELIARVPRSAHGIVFEDYLIYRASGVRDAAAVIDDTPP